MEDGIFVVRASGVLMEADYQGVLEPQLDAAFRRHGRLKVLFCMDQRFSGWTWRAAWTNTRLDLRYRDKFDKIAVVGAAVWESWCARIAGHLLFNVPIRSFGLDQSALARRWLRT